jgi:uncharacterized protein DUF1054
MLFTPPPRFAGLPAEAFEAFDIPDREERRKSIIAGFHPALEALAEDLLARLSPVAGAPLHAHLPRLDWPHGYQPFCTWLALSRLPHGYQAGPQLNVGVHRDHVAARLAWDTGADAFGRFEFLCRHGGLGEVLERIAEQHGLHFRVYAASAWPEGSRLVFESALDFRGAFEAARRHGVWLELGVRHGLPEAMSFVSSPTFGEEVRRVFLVLLPVFDRFQ